MGGEGANIGLGRSGFEPGRGGGTSSRVDCCAACAGSNPGELTIVGTAIVGAEIADTEMAMSAGARNGAAS
jgi:hypothetical protein